MSSNHKGREQEKEKKGERGLQNSQKNIKKNDSSKSIPFNNYVKCNGIDAPIKRHKVWKMREKT